MNETWWVDPSQLDERQLEILRALPDDNLLIIGPPGSGKTNLLILRANYVRHIGPRILFLTFTRSLAEFLRAGTNVGRSNQIQPSDIKTFMGWADELVYQHTGEKLPEENFDEARRTRVGKLEELIKTGVLNTLYDFAFVDEVQDFWSSELELVRKLAARINTAGDARQRIWNHREGLNKATQLADETVVLEKHYRIGEKICAFADQICPANRDTIPLLEGCNYPEESRPSSIHVKSCSSMIDSYQVCLDQLKEQIRYIPEEPIGIFARTNRVLDGFWEILLSDDELAAISVRQKASDYHSYGPDSRIRVMTIHSAKGSEFRAVHILDAESLTANMRELAFTAVTRAKTEVILYHVAPLPAHLTPATGVLPADISSLF